MAFLTPRVQPRVAVMAISAHEMIQVIAVGLSINSIHVSECIKWLLDCSPAHRRSLASASQSRLTC
jgi:hypothetical protein